MILTRKGTLDFFAYSYSSTSVQLYKAKFVSFKNIMAVQIIVRMFTLIHEPDSRYVLIKQKGICWRHTELTDTVSADCHMLYLKYGSLASKDSNSLVWDSNTSSIFEIILWVIRDLQLWGSLHLSVANPFSKHLSGHPTHAFKRTVGVWHRLHNSPSSGSS